MGFSTPTPPHDHFPQPTRPRFAADPEPDDELLITNRHVHHSINHHSHVTVDLPMSMTNTKIETTRVESSSTSSSSSGGNRVVDLSPPKGTTPKGEREAVDELLLILVDCLEELSTRNRERMLMKFFCDVERDERLEKFIVERLKQSKVKALTDLYDRIPPEIKANADIDDDDDDGMMMTRSVVESAEELTDKLERFKITTLDFQEEEEDVKKEEEDKDKSTK